MTFTGIPIAALDFYEDLEADNSKVFWTAHKTIYDESVRAPIQALVLELTDEFVKTASKQGMYGLKGYRSVGGIRASIYNAMPVEGCQALASFMKDFASKKS